MKDRPSQTARTLDGKRILFAGAIDERGGLSIISQLLRSGAQVLVATTESETLAARPERFAPSAGQLKTMIADFSTPAGVERVLSEGLGGLPLDAVVANLGGPSHGPKCTEAAGADVDALGGGLKAHMLLARAFLPVLAERPGSLYLMLNDSAALDPKPASGIAAAAAAGQLMLARSLSLEAGDAPVVHSLVVTPGIPGAGGQDEWLTPENVGDAVVQLIAHPEAARGDVVLNAAWRQQLAPGVTAEVATYL